MMEWHSVIIVVWLMGLTVSQVLAASALYAMKRQAAALEQRASELDTAERMQRIVDLIGKNKAAIDQDVRRNAELLLDAMNADPMAKERHWVAMQQLRSKLAAL